MGGCKISVWDKGGWRSHLCRKPVWKDEYCKIHHPESVNLRTEKSQKRWEEKRANDPLNKAQNRIKELEKENTDLKAQIFELKNSKQGRRR